LRTLKSLEFRLPLIAGLMLVATVTTLVVASYIAVRRTTLLASSASLLSSSEQISGLLKGSADSLRATLRRVSESPAVVGFLRNPARKDSLALIAAMQSVAQADRLIEAELRDSAGRRLFRWGAMTSAIDTIRASESEHISAVTLGNFHAVGDTIIYVTAAPVMDGGRRLGSLIQWRRQASSPQSRDQLAALFGGPGSRLVLGDTSGQVWTDLVGRVPGPPMHVRSGAPAVEYHAAGSGSRFVVARQGPTTPWVAVIDVPASRVMAPVRSFLRQMFFMAAAFLILVSFITWRLSRSITRPLSRLVVAADAFNSGDRSQRVEIRRDDEFGLVAVAFNRMAEGVQASFEALKEADRRKDEFLATLAHELRNPLAPIQNGVSALREINPPKDEPTARMYQIMQRQLEVLTRLVDDLLEVSRVTRGKVELQREQVNLALAVQHALESADPIIQASGHHLSVNVPTDLLVDGDPVRLSQIFFNLLSNAAKYTPPSGTIDISAKRVDATAVVTVRDNGDGIPREMLDRIFDMFVQVNQPGRRTIGGLGVGLTLVRELVEMHGGSVHAASRGPGEGSEFVVRLPLAPAAGLPAAKPKAATTSASADGLRALVVDDNKDAADTFAHVLRNEGVVSTVAYSGPQALEAVKAEHPPIVFLDLGMPGMDGFEVARRIRAAAPDEHPVLVAVTGWGSDEDRRRSAAAGFDHHLVKPVQPERLRTLLRALTGKAA
jgi:signal transduction histidine kinase/ActR/RegA family two-component response regulator